MAVHTMAAATIRASQKTIREKAKIHRIAAKAARRVRMTNSLPDAQGIACHDCLDSEQGSMDWQADTARIAVSTTVSHQFI
jgi:hypothetical protein